MSKIFYKNHQKIQNGDFVIDSTVQANKFTVRQDDMGYQNLKIENVWDSFNYIQYVYRNGDGDHMVQFIWLIL